MYVKKLFILAVMLFLFSACAFSPKVSDEQTYAHICDTFTKKLELTVTTFEAQSCRGDAKACLLAYGVVIPAGTFIVSGGLVLIGNTLHWLEYQGSCEDGFLLKSFDKFKTLVGLNN